MKCYVVGFMFNTDRTHVVLIRKNRPAWQAGKFNGVGGHIEPGESSVQAMVREFREETQRDTTKYLWDSVCVMYRKDDFECDVYRAFVSDFNGIQTCTDEEVVIVPLPVMEPRISNLDWLIAMCLDTNPGDFPAYSVMGKIGNYNREAL